MTSRKPIHSRRKVRGNGPLSAQMRLRHRILSGVELVNAAQACALLGLPADNPDQEMKHHEGPILRFHIRGETRYPRFQFDLGARSICPDFVEILRTAAAAGWSDFRLLHWMMRPHLDFDSTPAASLADHGQEVMRAFLREITPDGHG